MNQQVKFEKELFELSDSDVGLIMGLLYEAPYKTAAPLIAKFQTQLQAKFAPKPPGS